MPRPSHRRTGGRPRPALGDAGAGRRASSSWAMARPLVLTSTRTIGRRRPRRAAPSSWGYSVGSPPLSMRTSIRPFSRERRASIDASTSASGTTLASAGAEAAKHVGHLRLQWSRRSSSRMHVCWVCISGRPSAYAAGTGAKLPVDGPACAPSSARSTARGRSGSRATRRTACGPGRAGRIRARARCGPSRSTSQPERRCTSASGPVGPLLVAQRAEGVDVAVDAVAAQRHPRSGACRRRRDHAATRSRRQHRHRPPTGRARAIRSEHQRHRHGKEELGAGQAVPDHLVPTHELDEEPERAVSGDVPDEDLPGRQGSVPQPGPDDPEGDEVEDDLVGEGRVQRRAGRCTEAGGGIRVEGDAPAPPGGCTRLLGEQAADPADRHPEGDRGREEVTRAQPVAATAAWRRARRARRRRARRGCCGCRGPTAR